MKYVRLGDTGTRVSNLCLGTMTFGEADAQSFMHKAGCDEDTARTLMSRALDAGVNFWDTADVYGQDGLSEQVVGRWFEATGRRDEVVLATKFRFRMGDGPNGTGASRRRVMKTVEDSLRRLKTDRIDLYQVHCQDDDTPEEELLRALDDLVSAGKVLYVGASNYAAYRLVESKLISERRGWTGYQTIQMQYSLIERSIEREHVPTCRRFGMGILPWSPLGGGFLTGKYHRDQVPGPGDRFGATERWQSSWNRLDADRNWATLEALRGAATELDATPAAVALAWLLHKPCVTSVIFGARSIAQLEANLKAAELHLDAGIMRRLDEASAPDYGYPYSFIQNIQGPQRW
jgi:aryl-alcohol dehydrogenase-like predicted oxidoreductase